MSLRLAILALAAWASTACSAVTSAPINRDSPPEAVLEGYLRALVAGDCRAAEALATPKGIEMDRVWCDTPRVTSFAPFQGPGARPTAIEAIFPVDVVIRGGDASLPDGERGLFAQVLRQPDGRSLVEGLGSGP